MYETFKIKTNTPFAKKRRLPGGKGEVRAGVIPPCGRGYGMPSSRPSRKWPSGLKASVETSALCEFNDMERKKMARSPEIASGK